MDNWNDYTLSTDKYNDTNPNHVSEHIPRDMTETYDFTDLYKQAEGSDEPRAAQTADFTEEMQNAEPVVTPESPAEPAPAETTSSYEGPSHDGLYGFTMRDPDPEPASEPASDPTPAETVSPGDYTNTEFEPSGYPVTHSTGYSHASYDHSYSEPGHTAGAAAAAAGYAAASGYGASSQGAGYGSSYTAGGHGGGGYGGHGNGASSGYYEAPRRSRKKVKKPMEITKAGFVLALIFCMLLTSALTVGGMVLYGNHFAPGTSNATDYTLTSSDETLSYNSVIGKVQDSVVSITTEATSYDMWMQNYVTQGAGSGVIIQSNGYIVTCNHVIEGATKITVTLNNNKEYAATLIGADPENDVAVLKIKATGLTAASYGDSSKLVPGDSVIAIGNPLGELSNTATTGIISALDRELTIDGKTMNLMQTDASINPGNSGGALFDASGNLVGIVVAKSAGSDVEGLGFAIPINRVAELAKDMIENKDSFKSETNEQDTYGVGDAAIGVTVGELSDQDAAQYGYSRGGIIISSVTSRNAQQAGIQPGDMIVSFDGKAVSSVEQLHSALQNHKPGDNVKVGLLRGDQQVEVNVTLTQASE